MTYAYDEMYLDSALKNLGEAFDYAVNACHLDAERFLDLFISVGFAEDFGKGSPRLVAGLSGTELVMEVLAKAGLATVFPGSQTEYDFSPEYWCGWILAYYQWKTGRTFSDIRESIPMTELLKLSRLIDGAIEVAHDHGKNPCLRGNGYNEYVRKYCTKVSGTLLFRRAPRAGQGKS